MPRKRRLHRRVTWVSTRPQVSASGRGHRYQRPCSMTGFDPKQPFDIRISSVADDCGDLSKVQFEVGWRTSAGRGNPSASIPSREKMVSLIAKLPTTNNAHCRPGFGLDGLYGHGAACFELARAFNRIDTLVNSRPTITVDLARPIAGLDSTRTNFLSAICLGENLIQLIPNILRAWIFWERKIIERPRFFALAIIFIDLILIHKH
jgi:hypothetical protein